MPMPSTTMPLIGLDIGKNVHVYGTYRAEDLEPLGDAVTIHNNRAGFSQLAEHLDGLLARYPLVKVANDPTGIYYEAFGRQILAHFADLLAAGQLVYHLVNPHLVKEARNDVSALTDRGEVMEHHRRFANDRDGLAELQQWLVDVLDTGAFDALHIGGEATGLHGFHTFWHLQQLDDVAGIEPQVFLLNAHGVAHFKKALRERDKTDAKDAQAIAEHMRFGKLPHPLRLDTRYLALQRLTRYRFFLVHNLARQKVYAAQVALLLKLNTYQTGEPFSDPFAKSGQWALTTYATADELAACDVNQLARCARTTTISSAISPWASITRS